MIGDLPRRAPLRCKLGRHTGQKRGGLMCFQCTRCGGTFFQPKDYSAELRLADALITAGDFDSALNIADQALGRSTNAPKTPQGGTDAGS